MRTNAIIGVLLSTIATLLLLEVALQVVDPWGVVQYVEDARQIYTRLQADGDSGYRLQPGTHALSNWTLTTVVDGQRVVPGSNSNAGCTVGVLGDSVAMGFGVSDADTFVSLLAGEFQQARWVNLAMYSYNLDNVLQSWNATEHDAYIYMLVRNDAEPGLHWQSTRAAAAWQDDLRATGLYLRFARERFYPVPSDTVAANLFAIRLQPLSRADNVLVVSDYNPLSHIVQSQIDYFLPSVPVLSVADPHPSAAGHRLIADELHSSVQQLLDTTCSEKE